MAELNRRFGGATIIGSTTPFSSALARNEREIDSLLTDVDKADADKATDEFLKSGKPLETSDELFAGAADGATSTVAPTATTTSTTSTAASGSAASAEADPATTAEQRGNVASSGFAPETVASTPTEDTGTFDSLYYAPAGYKSRLVPFVQFYQDGSKKDKGKPLPGAYSALVTELLKQGPTRVKRGSNPPATPMTRAAINKAFKKHLSYATQTTDSNLKQGLQKKAARLNSKQETANHFLWVKKHVHPGDIFTFTATAPASVGMRQSVVATYKVLKRDDDTFEVHFELVAKQKTTFNALLQIPWSSVVPSDATSGTCLHHTT